MYDVHQTKKWGIIGSIFKDLGYKRPPTKVKILRTTGPLESFDFSTIKLTESLIDCDTSMDALICGKTR